MLRRAGEPAPQLRGITRFGLPVAELAPAAIKSAVAGSGRADKTQVARMVALQLGLAVEQLPADATDALAAALCFALGARHGVAAAASR